MANALNALLEFDRRHLWHPYTSATTPLPTQLVESAHGVRINLQNGRSLIDGMASWWCAIHGYNHPALNKAAKNQLDQMSHIMFGGLTHKPAIELGQLLLDITPSRLRHIFLADSGSISIEVAMKMAIQFWHAQGRPSKCKMLSLRGGYHGDTFAAMSVCDPVTGMHQLFNDALIKQVFTQRPTCTFHAEFNPACLQNLEQTFARHHHNLAAITLEPIVQGAGGMWFYRPEYLKRVRELCNEYDVLLIADEIATGFGRTGKLFACEWADIQPDIMCLGKALTGGYLSLAATLTSEKIAHGISQDGGVFMHGPTFMGNPLACAVALASTRHLLASDWQNTVANLETNLRRYLDPAKHLKSVQEVRVLGAIGVIEMKHAVDVAHSQDYFMQHGVWVRPFGKLIYVMPPYIITDSELKQLCDAMVGYALLSVDARLP